MSPGIRSPDDSLLKPGPMWKSFLPRYWASWVVGAMVAAAMVIIILPGLPVSYWDSPLQGGSELASRKTYYYQHGWPLIFLDRAQHYGEQENSDAHKRWWAYPKNRVLRKYRSISWSAPGFFQPLRMNCALAIIGLGNRPRRRTSDHPWRHARHRRLATDTTPLVSDSIDRPHDLPHSSSDTADMVVLSLIHI